MRVIFTRHGNTFEPNDVPYIVGANEDLPLVDSGIAQAREFGQALKDADISPTAWYSGPLTRTRQYVQIAMETLGISKSESPGGVSEFPIIDQRLVELDYGSWSGLADREVIEKFGAHAQQDWAMQAIWPSNANWKPRESQVKKEALSFLEDIKAQYQKDDIIVAASSSGRLRYFLTAIPGEFENIVRPSSSKLLLGTSAFLITLMRFYGR